MIFKIGKPSYQQRSAIWILYLRCLIYQNRLIHIRPSSLVYGTARLYQKMKKGDIHDPLLRQVLPDGRERMTVDGYSTDPLDENNHNPIKVYCININLVSC